MKSKRAAGGVRHENRGADFIEQLTGVHPPDLEIGILAGAGTIAVRPSLRRDQLRELRCINCARARPLIAELRDFGLRSLRGLRAPRCEPSRTRVERW